MIRVAAPESYASRSVARVRAWLAANHSQPRARLATEIGVDAKTLKLSMKDGWNPTADTLAKIEAVIPQDWNAPAPVPVLASRAATKAEEKRATRRVRA